MLPLLRLLATLLLQVGTAPLAELTWHSDLARATEVARERGQPLLIVFR